MSSRSINKVTILGNLTRDPELKYTPNNTAVCTFGVATNRSWTTADGQSKEEAQYHRIVAWQKLAELCNQFLTKGRKVYLEGRITYREYLDKSGQQRNITEIVLDDFIVFSDGKKVGAEEAGTQETESREEAPTPVAQHVESKSESNDEDVNPEDIPF
ncbi:single-stranded DNA-binding protein [Candidatus Woesebacteria bacterium]|nr:single-stranded DNA-binding protein [Candidatus Woesebacteria bacterium]